MPGYKTHLLGGILFYCLMLLFIYARFFVPTNAQLVEWLFFALVGSLFPDIDTKSKGQHLFYWGFAIMLGILYAKRYYQLMILLGFIGMLPLLVRHRGILHNILFIFFVAIAIVGYCSYAMPWLARAMCWNMLFFCVGALSHIWLDMGSKRIVRQLFKF